MKSRLGFDACNLESVKILTQAILLYLFAVFQISQIIQRQPLHYQNEKWAHIN